MVISDSEELNCVGLVDSNGKELISCEAAVIDKMQNYGDTTGSNRYVKVLYAGEVTTNEADAILYSTNDMISFGISGWQS